MKLAAQSCWRASLIAQITPAEARAVVAADMRKLPSFVLHPAPVEGRSRNSRFKNYGRPCADLIKVKAVAANVDQATGSREAALVRSQTERLIYSAAEDEQCGNSDGDREIEHAWRSVRNGEFAGQNRTRAWKITSDSERS